MKTSVVIEIAAPKDNVWSVITDIQNCKNVISAIEQLDILEAPTEGLVGLKWKETRQMFGQEATETMWITDAEEPNYYCTRAESHGSVYITKLVIAGSGASSQLTMEFSGEPKTIVAKVMSALMMPFFKSALKKALQKDLEDIKRYVENHIKQQA